jgi:glycosyltransferase involved in cell wall biosynthesis
MEQKGTMSVVREPGDSRANLTAVIPVTKRGALIEEMFPWVAEALEYGISIIVVHDKQDSLTGEALDRLINQFPGASIKVLEGKFGNPGETRNLGLENVVTEWVVFWDCDDQPFPLNCLEMIKEGQDFEVCIGRFQIRDLRTLSVKVRGRASSRFDVAMEPGLWRMVIKANIARENKFPPLRMGEDQVFLARLNLGNRRIHFSNSVVYEYRTNVENQLTGSNSNFADLIESQQLVKSLITSLQGRKTYLWFVYDRMSLTIIKRLPAPENLKKIFELAQFHLSHTFLHRKSHGKHS